MLRRAFIGGVAATAACARPKVTTIPAALAEQGHPPLGRLIEVAGLPVHVVKMGRSGPPVVLIHGANVNLRDWTFSLSDRLARDYRVLAMDRPGFGYSARGTGDWTPARQATQLRAAASALGVERPILVGHSWGAIVALAWALEVPDDVAGLVSVSGATMPWGFAADVASALGVSKVGVRYYMARLTRRAEEGAIEAFVTRAFTPQLPPTGYLDFVGAPLSLRAETVAANSEDLGQTHAVLGAQSRRYGQLGMPVEIVHGAEDWLLNPERHAHGFAATLPHARVEVVPGVGHMAHHARPDLLEAALGRISAASV